MHTVSVDPSIYTLLVSVFEIRICIYLVIVDYVIIYHST